MNLWFLMTAVRARVFASVIHCVAGPWLKKQPQFDQLEKCSEMQSKTDYVHIEKVPKIGPSHPSLSPACWTVRIQIQIRASSTSWNSNFHTKKHKRTLACSYYAALYTADAGVLRLNVSVSSALWIYFIDVLEYITQGF